MADVFPMRSGCICTSRWVHRSFDELEPVCHLLDTVLAKLGHD